MSDLDKSAYASLFAGLLFGLVVIGLVSTLINGV
jgi:hypothetical protein